MPQSIYRYAVTQDLKCQRFIDLAILSAVCLLLFFAFLGKIPFYDKGEPREALVVRDIVYHGHWVFPLKLEQQIPSKPPLFHWVAAAASIIWGEMTEATVRFPSALFATLGVLLIYYFGQKHYGRETGFIAALMLATTHLYQSAAIEARVDMTMVFFMMLSLVLFFGIYQGSLHKERWRYLFFLSAGVGVLAKGPVSLVLSSIIVGLFLLVNRDWGFFARLMRHPGIIVGIASFAIWYGIALWTGGSDFAGLQFAKENLARFFIHGESGTGHQKPVYYFLPYLFSLGLPWTIFLPVVAWRFFKEKSFADDPTMFLAIWFAVVFLLFSLSAGKRPPYILPLYPPLVLLIAAWCCRAAKETAAASIGIRCVGCFAAAVGATMGLLLAVHLIGKEMIWLFQPSATIWPSTAIGEFQIVKQALDQSGWIGVGYLSVGGALWLLIGRNFFRQRITAAVAQMAFVTTLTFFLIQGIVLPALANARSYKDFVSTVTEKMANGDVVLLFPRGVDSSSIVFYGGPKLERLTGDVPTLQQRLRQSHDYVILGERQWQNISAGKEAFPALLKSRGTGPDGDDPLVLIQGSNSP
jgi:4-amino-4-deoxy-L-arabinose transferase-like glycosyltransferase